MVYGRTPKNIPFRDITATKDVSAQGGRIPLSSKVELGQTVLLVHSLTGEERECRVVHVEPRKRGKTKKLVTVRVGVEFTHTQGDFWHVFGPIIAPKLAQASD
jgi:hypothetical protein